MDHASIDPRSGSTDTKTVPHKTPAEQAARAAYIARVIEKAPKMSAAQADCIALLFRPVAATNAAPLISVDNYRSWEIRRFENAETGAHGYFTADGEAA